MGDAKSDGQNSRAKLEDNIKLALYQLDNDKLDNTANQMTLFETDEPEQITFWTVFLTSTSLCNGSRTACYRYRRRHCIL